MLFLKMFALLLILTLTEFDLLIFSYRNGNVAEGATHIDVPDKNVSTSLHLRIKRRTNEIC